MKHIKLFENKHYKKVGESNYNDSRKIEIPDNDHVFNFIRNTYNDFDLTKNRYDIIIHLINNNNRIPRLYISSDQFLSIEINLLPNEYYYVSFITDNDNINAIYLIENYEDTIDFIKGFFENNKELISKCNEINNITKSTAMLLSNFSKYFDIDKLEFESN